MALTVERVRRCEVWDKWQCAGGVRVAIVPLYSVLSAIETVAGADRLSLVVALNSAAAPELIENRVVRLEDESGEFDEWKIVQSDASTESGVLSVIAEPLSTTDLARAGLVFQKLGDGAVQHDFEGVGLTPTQHLTQFVLPLLAAAGLSWIALGTITPVRPIDVAYQWDGPLAVLQRIAQAAESELQIRRVSTTGYAIDLVSRVGVGAQVADIRSEKNLVGLRVEKAVGEQANRVYPKGAAADEESGTIARASWKVSGVAGNVVTLADPAGGDGPIVLDSQLVGAYLRKASGVLTLVTASNASAQTVTVASSAGMSIDDLVQFRADNADADITWLDSPADIAAAGGAIRARVLDRSDIPAVNNLIPNPATRDWPGASSDPPTGWLKAGDPTIDKQVAAPYVKTGGNSIKVTGVASGDGVQTATARVFPTALHPYGSGFFDVWVVTGQVRVEMIFTTSAGEKVLPPVPKVASSSFLGQWESLGISGQDAEAKQDLFSLGVIAVALRVVQHGDTPAEFYVDSAQFTETPSQQPFVEGSGGTKLWQAANELLRTAGAPLVSYTAPVVDLARLDPVTWADAKLVLGGDARIKEPRLAVAVATRVLEIERDYVTIGNSRASLSNRPDDLSGTLSRPKRVVRLGATTGPATEELGAGDLKLEVVNETNAIRIYKVTRGTSVYQAWVGVLEFDSPLPPDPWPQVAAITQPMAAGVDTFTVLRPSGKRVTLIQVEPRAADFSVTGKPWQATLEAAPPQPPVWEIAKRESGGVGTLFFAPRARGEPIVSVSAQVRVGRNNPQAWTVPTRGAGDYSYIKARTLLVGEYEQDVRLEWPGCWVQPRAVLASGEVDAPSPIYFDADSVPDILVADGTGSVAWIVGDSDTASIKLERVNEDGTPLGWQLFGDGPSLKSDVQKDLGLGGVAPMGAGETWRLRATAYALPSGDPGVLDSASDVKFLVVTGSTTTPPAWDYMSVVAPELGSVEVPIVLDADSASGLTTRVRARYNAGDGFVELDAITSALTPVPGAPPLSPTTYTWSGLPATYERTDPVGDAREIELEIIAEILSGGAVVADKTKGSVWYYGGVEPPAPPPLPPGTPEEPSTPPVEPPATAPDPTWETPMTVTGPSLAAKNVTIGLDADSADGTVELLVRSDDGYGWTDHGDVASEVTPALSTPPTSPTSYNWNGLSAYLVRTSTGRGVKVEVTARIKKNGIIVATDTKSVVWLYTDTRL